MAFKRYEDWKQSRREKHSGEQLGKGEGVETGSGFAHAAKKYKWQERKKRMAKGLEKAGKVAGKVVEAGGRYADSMDEDDRRKEMARSQGKAKRGKRKAKRKRSRKRGRRN